MDDDRFVIESHITRKKFIRMRLHPVTPISRAYMVFFLSFALLYIAAGCGAWISGRLSPPLPALLAAMGLGMAVVPFLGSLSAHTSIRPGKEKTWTERIAFGDKITAHLPEQTTTIEWNQFGRIRDHGDYFSLWMSRDRALRLEKADFVQGDPAEFAAYAAPRLGELKSGSRSRPRWTVLVLDTMLLTGLLVYIFCRL